MEAFRGIIIKRSSLLVNKALATIAPKPKGVIERDLLLIPEFLMLLRLGLQVLDTFTSTITFMRPEYTSDSNYLMKRCKRAL